MKASVSVEIRAFGDILPNKFIGILSIAPFRHERYESAKKNGSGFCKSIIYFQESFSFHCLYTIYSYLCGTVLRPEKTGRKNKV